jgi:predicted acyl esterase
MRLKGSYFARRGYVAAVQNFRGRFGSEGIWEPFIHESKDGHNAEESLALPGDP